MTHSTAIPHPRPDTAARRPAHLAAVMFAAAVAAGCADSSGVDPSTQSTIQGSVTDGDGTQGVLGGAGTVEATATVRASAIAGDASLDVLAEAAINADGTYELTVPADVDNVLIEAVDGAGTTLASAILEATAEAGGQVTAPPCDTESSVEAAVYLEMLVQGVAQDDIDAIDLRARIDTTIAAAVAQAEAAGDASVEIQALAESCAAAQAAEIEAYVEAGVSISQRALFRAELAAAQTLSVALERGDAAADAYAAFLADLSAAAEAAGVSAEAQSEGEASASLAMRLTLEVRLADAGAEAEALIDAVAVAAGAVEADATARATEAILAGAGASADVLEAANAAAVQLSAQVSAATTAAAVADAYAAFSASIVGDLDVSGSILGDFLALDAGGEAAANLTLDACVTAAAALDAQLRVAVEVLVNGVDAVDADAVAAAVVEAWATYRAAVDAAVTANLAVIIDDAQAAATVSLFLEATGSFRASAE